MNATDRERPSLHNFIKHLLYTAMRCSPTLLLTQGMNKTSKNKTWALENTSFESTKAQVPGSHINVLGMMGNPVISELRRKR